VDDEETIHRALARTLRREPYDLLFASDAPEAAAILRGHAEIDAIICDHYMPGVHGLELLMEVRRNRPEILTVLLTAQADLALVISALNEGRIHRFFTKPWDAEQMRQQLRSLLFGAPGDADAPDAARTREAAAVLSQEMDLPRDELTGAYIIEPPAE
jgi:DNA-binding NtrC family response regulator